MNNRPGAPLTEARDIARVVCVHNTYNMYNVAHREDDELAVDGIAYVPFFPLGGFPPLQSRPSQP